LIKYLLGRYEQAVVLVACSAVVQMFAEVPWLLAQVFQFVRQVSKSIQQVIETTSQMKERMRKDRMRIEEG
jgi:hypothetical protein